MISVQEVLNPDAPEQQDEFTEWMRGPEARFIGAKRLPDGTYAGVLPLMFTYAICLEMFFIKLLIWCIFCIHSKRKMKFLKEFPKKVLGLVLRVWISNMLHFIKIFQKFQK